MKAQHVCPEQVLFDVELPCAYCTAGRYLIVQFGPRLGWACIPMTTHPLGYISGPLHAEMTLRKELVALGSLDSPDSPHVLGHWVLEKVEIPNRQHAIRTQDALR